jgi:PHP family Zn ribbon phosphoesterase
MKKLCPKCAKPLTIGVAHRVEKLADNPEGTKHAKSRPYRNLIPFAELIAHAIGSPVASQKTFKAYYDIVGKFGNEITVLLDTPEEELRKAADEKIVTLILRNREQKIRWRPGFDGEYGHPIFDEHAEIKRPELPAELPKPAQRELGEF